MGGTGLAKGKAKAQQPKRKGGKRQRGLATKVAARKTARKGY